jgi:hypothetical protein
MESTGVGSVLAWQERAGSSGPTKMLADRDDEDLLSIWAQRFGTTGLRV